MLSAGKETLLVKAVNHSSLNKLVTTSYKPNWMSSTHELSFNTVRVDIHLKQLPITNINSFHKYLSIAHSEKLQMIQCNGIFFSLYTAIQMEASIKKITAYGSCNVPNQRYSIPTN
jgi:hypothetical protein